MGIVIGLVIIVLLIVAIARIEELLRIQWIHTQVLSELGQLVKLLLSRSRTKKTDWPDTNG